MRLLQLFSASVLILSGWAGAASAETAGTGIVGNNYESLSGVGYCINASSCAVPFPPNTSGRVILINNVGCTAQGNGRIRQLFLAITDAGGWPVFKLTGLTLPAPQIVGNNHYYSINSDARLLLGLGKVPRLSIELGGTNLQVSCSLMGTFAQ